MSAIIQALDRDRFEPLLAVRPDSALHARGAPPGVEIFALSMRNALDLKGITRAVRLIRRRGVDLVLTYSGKDHWVGLIAAHLCHRPLMRMKNLELFKDAIAYNLADRVVVPSGHMRRFLTERGVRPARIRVLAPGVDTAVFRPDPAAGQAFRAALGIPSEAPLLTYVAHFREPKDQLILVEALAALDDPRPRLLLLGERQGPYGERVAARVRALGLDGRVWMPGRREDVAPALAASDLFLFPSRQEAMPRALMEALACGLPVIAADLPAVSEILARPGLGWTFPPADREALGERIRDALAALPEAPERAAERRAWIEERFSFTAMVRGFERLCEELTG